MNQTIEINIDALVGPTHHFSGMGVGNLASMRHKYSISSPKRAALEGLKKAKLLADLGIPQFLLPPPRRPRLDLLPQFGFTGATEACLQAAHREDIDLVSTIYSSSFMWAANSATVTAAADSRDGTLHLTVANLISSLHRSVEAAERFSQLSTMFGTLGQVATVHSALPPIVPLRDEGAANHMRFSVPHSSQGLNVFVHGDSAGNAFQPTRFLPRHTFAASRLIERFHQLDAARTFHWQQHPDAISAGVFHNDVIATSHEHLLLHHEKAFLDESDERILQFEQAFQKTFNRPLQRIIVQESELSLDEAVRSYLFNSQIVSPPSGPRMMLISPQQCREIRSAETVIHRWIANPEIPIEAVEYVELRESMAGGGGPACLRLRVPLHQDQVPQFAPTYRLDDSLYDRLSEVIQRHYPEELPLDDLGNIELAEMAWKATEAVCATMGIA